jgi:hypothetical protein
MCKRIGILHFGSYEDKLAELAFKVIFLRLGGLAIPAILFWVCP